MAEHDVVPQDWPWIVIVVRAWAEPGELKVRLLSTMADATTEQVVVDSVDGATATLRRWLEAMASGGPWRGGGAADA